MRVKRLLIWFIVLMLVIVPTILVNADSQQTDDQNNDVNLGKYSSKEEVVYALLDQKGTVKEAYVVNSFTIDQPGKIIDYGHYETVKNLTNLNTIEQLGDKVEFIAEEDRFYYQGNIKDVELPWEFLVTYQLNGQTIEPDRLAGKDGRVKIVIETKNNGIEDSSFFENYLLQVSLTVDTDIFKKIHAPKGMIANVGKQKQVSFTVLPNKEESLMLEADVVNFELDGIQISAVPAAMALDTPELDEMEDDFQTLSDAIKALNDGVAELNNGVKELHNGAKSLRTGSTKYYDGLKKLSSSSKDLVSGSKEIEKALQAMSEGLKEGTLEVDLSEFHSLVNGLNEMGEGLEKISQGLTEFLQNYKMAFQALDGAMENIPTVHLSEEDVRNLYASNADQKVISNLIDVYTKAQIAKGTYGEVKKAFSAVEITITQINSSLEQMSSHLNMMANEFNKALQGMDWLNSLQQLQEGIDTLAKNYTEFHHGLVAYTDGIKTVTNSYQSLNRGISSLASGTGELQIGVSELYSGTNELYEATKDLPNQIQEEFDQMIREFDKSDFQPTSFVSEKNERVEAVQFVMKIEPIYLDDFEITDKEVEEESNFWTRLKDLFQ